MQVLEEIRARDQETPIFMITAYGSVEVAVDALKRGASDYFPKPWDNEKLLIEIDRMISKRPAGARKRRAEARAEAALQFPEHRRARASGCSRFWTWWRRWRPAARPF